MFGDVRRWGERRGEKEGVGGEDEEGAGELSGGGRGLLSDHGFFFPDTI